MRKFLLMGTEGCHLCDDAAAIVVATLNPALHEAELVDIAFEDEYMTRYAVRIPVLLDDASGKELDWPFDQPALQDFLRGLEVSE
ncbi:glutaredoxin family protein [Aliamphritea hakodatensis]|uniref:glutaredoxin family protein n=1 Tax=Aliamphritea hakodatensis TaxID=2895352 RepID=UPI0022FD75C3|nr:glutaredoxin family protein [Aliamphritea hakodatensis]